VTAKPHFPPEEKQLGTASHCTVAAVKTVATGWQETVTDCDSVDLLGKCSLVLASARFHAAFQPSKKVRKLMSVVQHTSR